MVNRYYTHLMEFLILGIFAALLISCLITELSILLALAGGFFLFAFYSLRKGFGVNETLRVAWESILTAKNILLSFFLIGMLTGMWRASGTIAALVCYGAGAMRPGVLLLSLFLLNGTVSFLTGTAFGTSATMGSVTMTLALTMNLDPLFAGGAILSGCFFGDRCSPVSTSAMLVAQLTETSVYDNIRNMVRSAAIPFAITCVLYLILGKILPIGTSLGGSGTATAEVRSLFEAEYALGPVVLIPAVLVLVLAAIRTPVKRTLFSGVVSAFLVGLFYQKIPIDESLYILLRGFRASDPAVSSMLNGGGVLSMLKVTAIVCISSSYSGIFRLTGMLDVMMAKISALSAHIGRFPTLVLTSLIAGMIACNQTLTIMLAHQLCGRLYEDTQKEQCALALEDSAVVIAPLIPWSIAGAVVLTTVGAPTGSILFAFYLILLPVFGILKSILRVQPR